jgi:hypothetical protein
VTKIANDFYKTCGLSSSADSASFGQKNFWPTGIWLTGIWPESIWLMQWLTEIFLEKGKVGEVPRPYNPVAEHFRLK